jgi:hypothetical protein
MHVFWRIPPGWHELTQTRRRPDVGVGPDGARPTRSVSAGAGAVTPGREPAGTGRQSGVATTRNATVNACATTLYSVRQSSAASEGVSEGSTRLFRIVPEEGLKVVQQGHEVRVRSHGLRSRNPCLGEGYFISRRSRWWGDRALGACGSRAGGWIIRPSGVCSLYDV